jgi:hypothetical protein
VPGALRRAWCRVSVGLWSRGPQQRPLGGRTGGSGRSGARLCLGYGYPGAGHEYPGTGGTEWVKRSDYATKLAHSRASGYYASSLERFASFLIQQSGAATS